MSQQRWRPPVLNRLKDQALRDEADRGFQRIFTLHEGLESTAVQAVSQGGGFRLSRGSTTVLGSKTGIPTGLSSVTHVVATIDSNGTAFNEYLTARPTPSIPGAIDIFIWAPTAVNDVTPIPSTTSWLVNWTAPGTVDS